MTNQRRFFIRNIGLTALGLPLASNLAFSKTLSDLNGFAIVSSITTKLKDEGFELLFDQSFNLNKNCKAIPLLKQSLLFGDEEGLLVIMDDNSYFVLNSKQLKVYKEFIANFKTCLSEHNLQDCKKVDTVGAITPTELLKSNASKDFRFKNSEGRTVEVRSFKKQNYVKVV